MDNIYWICASYGLGTLVTFIIMKSVISKLKKRIAHLMNESDFYYVLNERMFESMSESDKELHNIDPRVKQIKRSFEQNRKQIEKKGKY